LSAQEDKVNFLRVLLITLAVAFPIHAQVASNWTFEEHQLDIKQGGRVNSVAVNPVNGNEMFVASETGGLFKSTDAGLHWRHIDPLPVIFTQSVVYLPSGAVLVSSKADFRKTNGGGVWRSGNGEDNWTQTLTDTVPGERLNAYEISVQPATGTVFVGTSHGLFQSINGGVSWQDQQVAGDPRFISILAANDAVYTGGPSGVRILVGAHSDQVFNVGSVLEMHAFAPWPQAGKVFFVNSAGHLYYKSVLTGWASVESAPPAGNCEGIPFIKAVERPVEGREWLYLYFSNRCGLYTLVVPVDYSTLGSATWHVADVDEDAPRDLALNADGDPVLLGTTAGLHNRPNGLSAWRLVGGGRNGGFNALQINEVKGQLLDGNLRADLYIGTQDNKLWAWPLQTPNDPLLSHGSEGHFIELATRDVAPLSDCKMTFVVDEQRKKSEELFNGLEDWSDAPGEDGAPAMIRQGQYVQQVKGTHSGDGLALTRACGRGWEPFALFNEEPRDLPKLARAGDPGDPASTDVVYQAYKASGGRNLLMRIERPVAATGGVTPHYPAMTDFGSIGINPTMFAWYQVYAVDPGEPLHLIAADVAGEVMRKSNNGGEDWKAMTEFTDQVLGTDFIFRAALNGPAVGEIFPLVTAVSFSPQDPRLVLAGTSQAGIFTSADKGETWTKIPNSERMTEVTSFYWETANTVFVSTYGRGLWKMRNRRIAAPFEDFCGSCQVVSNDSSPSRPPFDGSVLAFDGHILGVRTSNKQLREVFVTPGSSVLFTGDLNDPQEDIAITVSDARDAKRFEPLPKGPDGSVATGVVFAKGDELTGAAFAKTEMSLLPPPSGKQVKDSTESPTAGKPYIRLTASASRGVATAVPEELLQLSATDFTAGSSYEVLVDGAPVKGTVTADRAGSFTTTITAPSQTGYHRVEVRLAGDEPVIDSSIFLVKY
jgi:hypothetical protein